jgi:S1-C subfamily serine protease
MSINKLDPQEPAEVAYYDGYQRGHNDTARMLARRSLMYLMVGMFFGGGLIFLFANTGVLDRLTSGQVVEDPALSQEKPKEYVKAIEWAKRFTVGIVAKTAARVNYYRPRIPGQSHIGSGVILTDDGYILTNAHVVPDDPGATFSVVLGDDLYEARFVGKRPEYDIAVIKINATGLAYASLGDSDKVEQGDVVIAIGSPHGLFHTATDGIISYAGRRSHTAGSFVQNYLQTSAAINPGNSGGPLIDLTGRVIGINTWKLAGQGQESADGIGFAIPINVARKVSQDIIKTDDRERDNLISSRPRSLGSAFLGVQIEAAYRPESDEAGAMISEVIIGTAAEAAGLQPGDRIIEVQGVNVANYEDLRKALSGRDPGEKVTLTYVRGGRAHKIEVTLGQN